MASLLDVAKEMQKTEEEKTITGAAAARTLADVARDQDKKATASTGMTLLDVARQQQASVPSAAAPPARLSSLARQIDAEDAVRVVAAMATAARDVKSAQLEARREAVAQALEQGTREEERAAAVLQTAVTANQASAKVEDEQDAGYSSFEDEEKEAATPARSKPRRQTTAAGNQQLDEQSEGDEASADAGPERTTPSDSKASKEFLRAVFRADKHRIRELLGSGDVDANTSDQHGWSALHWAASQTHADVLASLLSHGARVNLVDHMNGWAPLHVAAVRQSVRCVELLLGAGADPRVVDLYGDSPADIAAAARGKTRLQLLQLLQGGDRD